MTRIIFPALAAAMLAATPAAAQTGPDFVDITFTGTVTQAGNDTIVARNPGGSTTTLTGDQIPDYRFNPGDSMVTTFRFLTDQNAFGNPACGGRYTLGFAAQVAGSCFVEMASVRTPFGQVGLGGAGGDAFPTLTGLELVRDDTGAYSIAMPTGSYSMRYVGVNFYQYDSATGTLRSPTSAFCFNTFSCPNGVITGTATGWTTDIPIVGDFGLIPVANGYNAGSAGLLSIFGSFNTVGGNPVDVPEPASLLFFAGGAAAVMARRRKRKTVA